MYGVIKVGERDLPLLANAATPIRYKQVFHRSLMPFFLGQESDGDSAEMVGELAYVMARAAEGADMNKLSFDDYVNWLEGFDAMAFSKPDTAGKVMDIYAGNQTTDAEVKKNHDQPTAG